MYDKPPERADRRRAGAEGEVPARADSEDDHGGRGRVDRCVLQAGEPGRAPGRALAGLRRLGQWWPRSFEQVQDEARPLPFEENAAMIIADTGFWLALANARDRHHQRARRALSALNEPLITTWPVLTETCHLLVSKLGAMSSARFV